MAQNSDSDKRGFFNRPEDHSSGIRFSPDYETTAEGDIFVTRKTRPEDAPISEEHLTDTPTLDDEPWQPETAIEAVYKVAELLGKGSYGTVHRIYDANLQMYLAVKTPLESTRSERFREREAYQLLDIGLHPNIASCIYVRTLDDGKLRLFIEYVSKKNLADLLNKNQITSLEMALDIGIQICWGMGWVHKRLVHRDISPRNILMASNRQPKVADFGLVKPIDTVAQDDESVHENKINSKGSLGGGTPGYAAPEQGQPDGVITLATDVYSVGVVLYEILQPWLGWPLFPDAEAGARPTFYRGALEKYESALAKILWCCLAFEPEERFQDANELADRLIEIYHELIGQPYQRKPSAGAELIADGLNNKAISLIHLKKPAQDVVACFEKALKSQPDHPETLYNACLYHWHLGQLDHYEKLLQQLRGLEREQPDNWRYPYLVGRLWLEQGYRDAAIPKLEAALIKSGGDGQVAQVLRGAKIPPEDCIPLQGHTDVVTAVAITPDGQQILSASLDKTVRLWDIKTGRHKILGEHTKGVNAIAISPDGRLGISGGDDGAIRVWDLISGECIQRVKWRRLFDSSITSVSLVKYFKSEYLEMLTIVTGSRTGRLGICDMKRWENDKYTQWSQSLEGSSPLRLSSGWVEAATAGKFRSTDPYRVEWQTFKTKYGPIKAMVAVPSIFEHRIRKDRILLANADQTPRLWYIGSDFYGYTKELIATFKGHTASVNAIAVSLDKEVSHLVLSGGDDHTLRRWYISEYLLYQDRTGYITIEGHTGPVTAVAISPNGSNFALSGSADKTVRLWRGVQVGPGTCLKIFQGHTDRVTSVAISPDGSWGVSASADQTLRLWRLENPKSFQPPSYLLVRPQDKDKTLGFGSLIAEAERCLSKGQLKEAGDLAERARQIPGYERSEQVVKFWAKLVKAWMRQAEQAWDEGHYKKAGYLVEQARQVPEYKNWWHTMDFTAKFARKGVRQGLYASRPVEAIKGGNSIAISANGRCVLSSYDKTLHWWDLKNQECLKTLPEQPERINCIALFPDGRQAISGDEKGALYLWNVQQGDCPQIIPAHSGEVKAIAVSPNGQLVLSGGGAGGRKLVKRSFGELRLWKMTEGGLTRLGELKGHTDLITCVAISPDGRWGLSGGCDRTIRLWDLATGQCLRKFIGHTKWVQTVAFLPNNRYVLSTRSYLSHWPQHEYEEPVIWLWDIQRGRCLRAVGVWSESPSTALPLDNKWVYSEPGLWDLETGELRSEVTTFSAITASPDSRYIVDKNGMVHILDWTYEFPDPVDWDEGARPYLETFLTLEAASQGIEEIRTALASTHIPHLTDDDFEAEDSPEDEAIPPFEYKFKQLLIKLSYGGYGWLRPKGVWRELQQMASVWEGPQPLPELFWMTKVLNLLSQIKVWWITFWPSLVAFPLAMGFLLLQIMLSFVIFLIIAILVWLAWWISH